MIAREWLVRQYLTVSIRIQQAFHYIASEKVSVVQGFTEDQDKEKDKDSQDH